MFNDKYWIRNNNDQIKGWGIIAQHTLGEEMDSLNTNEAYSHKKRSSSNSAINAMLELAKPYMSCSITDFDSNALLFNCANGTYDLDLKIFREHQSSDMLTKITPVIYDAKATAPRWLQFLDEIFLKDKELIDYMQRVVGYAMTASISEQCMFIFYGMGRNGKSKFLDTISHIMGDYSMNCPSSMLTLKIGQSIPNDVARLKGSRMATGGETNQNVTLDEELIKRLTGDRKITARFLNKEYFDFLPTFKIFIATNHKPNIRGTDTGIWRRIQMIPFNLNLTEEQDDKQLGSKLEAESSGILNWMIEGYNKWIELGLKTPESVRNATQLYREEEDDLGQFIRDECTEEKGSFVSVADFKDKFKEVNGYYKSNKIITEYMRRSGHIKGDNRVIIHGKQQRGYINIRLKNEMDNIKGENVQWKD